MAPSSSLFVVVACVAVCVAALAPVSVDAATGSVRGAHNRRQLWGPQGHEITASIAARLISSSVAQQVSTILDGASMESVSTWADDVKHEAGWEWSAPLHFLNTPTWYCNFTLVDCEDNSCLYGALLNYTSQLHSPVGVTSLDALKFVIHFVGDLHQPLHVAFLADRGGNAYTGDFLDVEGTTLHDIWDTHIIQNRLKESFDNSMDDYIDYLAGKALETFGQPHTLTSQATYKYDLQSWATGTATAACKYAYVDSTGKEILNNFRLYDSYYKFTYPIVDQQLILGGQRLASTLATFL